MNQTNFRKQSRRAVLALSGWLLSACSMADTGPTAPLASATANTAITVNQVAAGATAGVQSVSALRRLVPIERSVTAAAVIGRQGGSIALPTLGLRLVVPSGAVDAPTNFSVTALEGRAVAYEFAPHGIVFKRPLRLEQKLGMTNWLPGLQLKGGYFKDGAQVNTTTGASLIDEVLPAWRTGGTICIELWHFSGYLVSMS
jgi:ZU5 domain